MSINNRKQVYGRRLARTLLVLLPLLVFLVCLNVLAGQVKAESRQEGVRINELMAKNLSGLTGQDSQPVDWIEIYNDSSEPFSLGGVGISNKLDDPYIWVFPDATLAAGERLVVYMDGLDCTDESGFHTGFQLSGSGGTLILTAPDGATLDTLTYPAQSWDVAYGRLEQDPGQQGFFSSATPGSANPTAFWGGENDDSAQDSTVRFSHPAGGYTESFTLEMESSDPDAIILYTLDGSEPGLNSLIYTKGVQIRDLTGTPNQYVSLLSSTESLGGDTREFYWTDEDGKAHVSPSKMLKYLHPQIEPVSKAMIVRARTYQEGKLGQTITTASYFVNSEEGFPRVSITSDPDTLFDTKNGLLVPGGIHWAAAAMGAEQSQNIANYMTDASAAANCEVFASDGSLQWSASGTMKLSGNASRLEKQKSLLFTDGNGKSLKLRTQHNNNVVYYPYLDAFWKNYLSGEGIGAIESSFVDLYIDGEYWGIYSLQDTMTENLAKLTGAEKKQIYLCKFKSLMAQEQRYGIEYANGGKNAQREFEEFQAEVRSRDFRLEENRNWLESQMDVDNLIRYLAAELYLQNSDWESNNVSFWKTSTDTGTPQGDGRWRQALYDLDMTMSFVTIDTFSSLFEIDFSQGSPAEWEALLEEKITEKTDAQDEFFPLLVCKLWQSPEFRQRFKDYALQVYSENGIYGTENVKAALQDHFDQLEGQMERNLQRLYGSDGLESRMAHWYEQSEELYNFAEERAEYMLWYTNRACYEG